MSVIAGSNPRRISGSSLTSRVGGYSFFEPTSIANCTGWFDASDASSLFQSHTGTTAVTANNDPVGYITNKAASNHATQSTAGSRALYKPNIQNGRSVLLFDGSDDWYALSSSLQTSNSGSMTVFFAGRLRGDGQLRGTILTERVAARVATFQFFWQTLDGKKYIASDGANASSNSEIADDVYWNCQSFFLTTFTHVVNSRIGLRVNRTAQTVSSGTQSSLSGTAGARIGRRESSVTQYFVGYMGELIVYAAELTSAQIADVERYLAYKWGVL